MKLKWQFMHGVAQQDRVPCHIHLTNHHEEDLESHVWFRCSTFA